MVLHLNFNVTRKIEKKNISYESMVSECEGWIKSISNKGDVYIRWERGGGWKS